MRQLDSEWAGFVGGGHGERAFGRVLPIRIQPIVTSALQPAPSATNADPQPDSEIAEETTKAALMRHSPMLSLYFSPPDTPFLDGGF